MTRAKTVRIEVPLFSRRAALQGAAAGVAAATSGCELLDLPEVIAVGSLDPVTSNERFYLQHAFGTPEIDPETLQLAVFDRGEEVGRIDKAAVLGLAMRRIEHTLQCIGSNPSVRFIGNAIWGGLPFAELLEQLGIPVPQGAREIRFEGADGYWTTVPASDLLGQSEDTQTTEPLWLVWEMNGEELPLAHGAPFRFLTPGRYGTKNPKWPTAVDFIDEPELGYWEQPGRDWSNSATYQLNAMVLSPRSGTSFGEGEVAILGSAFAGPVPIGADEGDVGIEASTDGGETWQEVEITYRAGDVWEDAPVPYGPDSEVPTAPPAQVWTQWRFTVRASEPGTIPVRVRARSRDGRETTGVDGTSRKDGYDGGMEIELVIT